MEDLFSQYDKIINDLFELCKLYIQQNKIEELCDNNNCNSYDLNKMINYYDKNCNYMDCDVFRVICCAEQRPFCPGE